VASPHIRPDSEPVAPSEDAPHNRAKVRPTEPASKMLAVWLFGVAVIVVTMVIVS
jgi:hypothetical protein